MKDLVLGVGYLGHDSSAALVDMDGHILFCLTEERFSNIKHDGAFPCASISKIQTEIEKGNLGRIRYVAINHEPRYFVEQKLFHYLDTRCSSAAATRLKSAILDVLPDTQVCHPGTYPMNYLADVIRQTDIPAEQVSDLLLHLRWCLNRTVFTKGLQLKLQRKFPDANVIPVPHHQCHAASAFYASGFASAAIMTLDGYGEDDTITLGYGQGKDLSVLSRSGWPNSLGLLYSMVTVYLGFDWFGDEYKVMGMAAYGQPTYRELFAELGEVNADGEFHFNPGRLLQESEVPGAPGEIWYGFTPLFESLLGGARSKNEEFIERHFNIAASLQAFVEDVGLQMAKYLRKQLPDTPAICIAGGVGLNGLMNQRIYKEAGFDSIYIQPASSDDGTALGAALTVVAQYSGLDRFPALEQVFFGLEYPESQISEALAEKELVYTRETDIAASVARLLAEGQVVARYEGRSEFGPRALGHRSIMASPLKAEMKDIINSRIKHRERFRPFAPACLAEHVRDFFDTTPEAEYMLQICQVNPAMQQHIPAVVHNDGTARVQSVHASRNPGFYRIISEFYNLTGVPVVINTSFNVNGETIVETPLDAIECFLFTDIDYLAIGPYLVAKQQNLDKALHMPADAFLNRRKTRYLDKYWSKERYWGPEIGTLGVARSELDAQEQRYRWRRNTFALCQLAKERHWAQVCIVGAGETGMVMLKTASQYLDIQRLADRHPEQKQTCSLPVMTLLQVFQAGSRQFLIASDAYEMEMRQEVLTLAQQLGCEIELLSFSDVG